MLTEVFVVKVVREENGCEALDVLVARWLSPDVVFVRWHDRVTLCLAFSPSLVGWGWRSRCLIGRREQGLTAVRSPAIDIDTMPFFDNVWTFEDLLDATPLTLELQVSPPVNKVNNCSALP
jgi:hypothetical protein